MPPSKSKVSDFDVYETLKIKISFGLPKDCLMTPEGSNICRTILFNNLPTLEWVAYLNITSQLIDNPIVKKIRYVFL